MTSRYIANGVRAARKKPTIVLLVWAVQFLVGLVVAIPMASAMSSLAGTGFSLDMAREIDLGIIFDMLETIRPAFRTTFLNLLWAIPLLAVVRAIVSVGIINAVRDGGIRSFWSGVGRYGPKSIFLSVPYFLLTAFLQVAFLFVIIAWVGGAGEKLGVLLVLVAMPIGMTIIGGLTDCMRDYAQISLVVRNTSVVTAVGRGVQWPFRHPAALWLYVAWMIAGIFVAFLPLLLENWITAATVFAIVALAVTQQIALIGRAAITVAWYGSEVAFFDEHAEDEPPLIAEVVDDTIGKVVDEAVDDEQSSFDA